MGYCVALLVACLPSAACLVPALGCATASLATAVLTARPLPQVEITDQVVKTYQESMLSQAKKASRISGRKGLDDEGHGVS
jgi:hypothetical protein